MKHLSFFRKAAASTVSPMLINASPRRSTVSAGNDEIAADAASIDSRLAIAVEHCLRNASRQESGSTPRAISSNSFQSLPIAFAPSVPDVAGLGTSCRGTRQARSESTEPDEHRGRVAIQSVDVNPIPRKARAALPPL
jgi:hypothetical protein